MHIVSKLSSLFSLSPTDKPVLLEEFYPLPFNRYISIFNEESIQSNCYDYFNDVIFDLQPYLKKEQIKIIQFINNSSDKRLINSFHLEGFSRPQMNFLIKRSLLHLCTDPYSFEIAGIYSTPSICLVGNRFAENSFPWYAPNSESHVVLGGLAYKKPTFAQSENPKSINEIKTEKILESSLEMLKLNPESSYKTIFTGNAYHEKTLYEFVPAQKTIPDKFNGHDVLIRLDKLNNEENCDNICSLRKFSVSLSELPSAEFLEKMKKYCTSALFHVSKDTKAEDVLKIINLGVSVKMVYDKKTVPNDIMFRFIDIGKVHPSLPPQKGLLKDISGCKFRASRIIVRGEKLYPSYAHLEKGIELGIMNETIPSKTFLDGIDRYKIFKEKQ